MARIRSMNSGELIAIPIGIRSLDDFRAWTQSPSFPEAGRIDFLNGQILIDLSAEAFFEHGGPKVEIVRVLANIARNEDCGQVCTTTMRVVSPAADLSCEPDVFFLSDESWAAGRVKLMPESGPAQGTEIEGGPDLVVEVVSDSSVIKDRERLPKAYYAAGVREYWLVDARREELQFEIFTRGATAFRRVRTDAAGFCRSTVLARKFRLKQSRQVDGYPEFELVSE